MEGDDAARATGHARSTHKWKSATRRKPSAITNVRDHFHRPGRYHAARGIRRLRSHRGPWHDNAASRAARSGSPPGTTAADHQPQTRAGRRARNGAATRRVTDQHDHAGQDTGVQQDPKPDEGGRLVTTTKKT